MVKPNFPLKPTFETGLHVKYAHASTEIDMIKKSSLQVNLCRKLLFLHQLTHNGDRLVIELQVQYMKIPSSEHGENMLWTEIVFDIQNNFCTKHVLPMFCKKKSFCQRFTCKRCIIFLKNLIDLCFVVFQLFNSNLPNLITVRTKCRVCCLAYWPLCRVANQSHLWF